ncbi:MAG: ATP-binding protein [Deferribacteraceae bacterium]|jgi:predicted AAA+ superfamily ATPase|nr:ATP-binding protein [Deferribacteraceae bacterium]
MAKKKSLKNKPAGVAIEPTGFVNFNKAAYRWHGGELAAVHLPESISKQSLLGLDEQQALLNRNLKRFISGKPALNVLLWGEKGAGKSTLVRLWAKQYAAVGLRIVEFRDTDYYSIYELYRIFRANDELSFILYFDDVSFDNSDENYRDFKSIVEGGLESKPQNVIFVATSNRRHLVSEKAADTDDLYNRDSQNESTSLFARFGLAVGFYPINKELYLDIVKYYFDAEQLPIYDGWQQDAENFAIDHGGRSGRTAQQFVIYKQIHN